MILAFSCSCSSLLFSIVLPCSSLLPLVLLFLLLLLHHHDYYDYCCCYRYYHDNGNYDYESARLSPSSEGLAILETTWVSAEACFGKTLRRRAINNIWNTQQPHISCSGFTGHESGSFQTMFRSGETSAL